MFISVDSCTRLCNELDNATSLLNLLLGLLRDVARADDDGDFGKTTFAKDLGVAQREEIKDGGLIGRLLGEVLVTLLSRNEGPKLVKVDNRLPELLRCLVAEET